MPGPALPVIDHVALLEGGAIRTTRYVSGNERIFAGHYAHFPIFPGVFLLEMMLQSADRLLEEGEGAVFRGVKSLRMFSPAYPGDVLDCEVSPRAAAGTENRLFEAVIQCRGRVIAKAVLAYAPAVVKEAVA